MEYTMEMTGDDPDRLDTIVDADGATVIVENRALFYVLGSEIDFIDTPVTTEFVFKNPNASGMCGCGSTIRRFRCCVCLCGCCCCFCLFFSDGRGFRRIFGRCILCSHTSLHSTFAFCSLQLAYSVIQYRLRRKPPRLVGEREREKKGVGIIMRKFL